MNTDRTPDPNDRKEIIMATRSITTPKIRSKSAAVQAAAGAPMTNLDRSVGVFETISAQAWARGSALAIKCLDDSSDLDKVCMCDEGRDGGPQDNVLYRYLLRLRLEAGDDPDVERAFCSVLTDMLASAVGGCGTWDIGDIEVQARASGPVAQAVRP
jgi:hypothetical protein